MLQWAKPPAAMQASLRALIQVQAFFIPNPLLADVPRKAEIDGLSACTTDSAVRDQDVFSGSCLWLDPALATMSN